MDTPTPTTRKRQASESLHAPRILLFKKNAYPRLLPDDIEKINTHIRKDQKLYILTAQSSPSDAADPVVLTHVLRSAAAALTRYGEVGSAGTIQAIWRQNMISQEFKEEEEFMKKDRDAYPEFLKLCDRCVSSLNWEEMLYDETLNDTIPEPDGLATMHAFKLPYLGEADKALWKHMHTHCKPYSGSYERYAHHLVVVQSSGMGKSRMVDELSKSHFVIPIVTRSTESGEHRQNELTYHVQVFHTLRRTLQFSHG
ncbi:uncharacterized protein C8Q71DRAFT_727552 [Rhodofomes roseus]|uniref:Uncharacterized protein n=1 Tax=Rhodofomes roseus TaxID=34475 RepID=A0ABQ8K112_9APHY|nr:uncharacterized protein C8Q71DRAFT_727552 [Rhodofomes roseus]KAH9830312.1 hypothetical protein C8Q71DRAFT_727552 [Rhodofomes roseus]